MMMMIIKTTMIMTAVLPTSNDNMTQRSPVQSVIIRADLLIKSTIADEIQ